MKKSQDIIELAMRSQSIYKQMVQRESEVWSKHFSDEKSACVRDRENVSRKILKKSALLNLAQVLKHQGLRPLSGLSLGCGSGRAERFFIKQGVCNNFHGIDIAPSAIDEAKRLAEQEGVKCTYEVQDLNFVSLQPEAYDLVVAQTSLHHVLHLEHVLDQVIHTLKTDGVFWVHDYIGETQFQFSEERLQIMNELLDLLPECLRINQFTGKPVTSVIRREPGSLVSPFESIRSGEIKNLLLERFEVLVSHETTTFLDRVVGLGMAQNYIENEDRIALFRVLEYFDHLLAEKRIIEPVNGQYLLRVKRGV